MEYGFYLHLVLHFLFIIFAEVVFELLFSGHPKSFFYWNSGTFLTLQNSVFWKIRVEFILCLSLVNFSLLMLMCHS